MADYFRSSPAEEAIWAVAFLCGQKLPSMVSRTKIREWAGETAGVPDWLFEACYDAVGDQSETISLLLGGGESSLRSGAKTDGGHLGEWVESRLLPLADLGEQDQKRTLQGLWTQLTAQEIFLMHKLLGGGFRVGVSQDLVVRALGEATGVPVPILAHRLMGKWKPTPEFFAQLISPDAGATGDRQPFPFCLAHPIGDDPASLGPCSDYLFEWKWDGIRCQAIRRNGVLSLWSRGEELVNEAFPEVLRTLEALPDGITLDAEILAWDGQRPMPFTSLQRRLGRKNPGKKLLSEVPVVLVAYDLLELEGQDLREVELDRRRELLRGLTEAHPDLPGLRISEGMQFADWPEAEAARARAREMGAEGLMIKGQSSLYLGGRKRGIWWKWKLDPFTIDAVLLYAQRGTGRRASLYTDYTFAVWRGEELLPIAKAYSGLNDEEIAEVDAFIRKNTLESFGPVRSVKPELVFEIAFESIQLSSRHKSGIAVRFPRIARWRRDKSATDADTLESVKALLATLR